MTYYTAEIFTVYNSSVTDFTEPSVLSLSQSDAFGHNFTINITNYTVKTTKFNQWPLPSNISANHIDQDHKIPVCL